MVLQGTIEVRPNPGSSKSNRLSAHSLSLEELLRYTDDDTKETAFEVCTLPCVHACCSNNVMHFVV
jgi:LAIKA domain